MTEKKITEIVGEIVDLLTPLASEERIRAVKATLTLLGEEQLDAKRIPTDSSEEGNEDEYQGIHNRAKTWMKQNALSVKEILEVFHMEKGNVEVIAPEMPGKDTKSKTYSAYIVTGIAKLLATGEAAFDDKAARSLCETSGCYDSKNHATYLKQKGNEFSGNKSKGWTLTAPGLKRGAEIVKELNK